LIKCDQLRGGLPFLEFPSLFPIPIFAYLIFLEVFMPTPTPRVSVRTRRVALVALAIISICLTVTATIVNYQRQQPAVQKINYSQIYGLAEAGGAVALQIEGATLTVTKADGSLLEATVTGEAAQHEVVRVAFKPRELFPACADARLNRVCRLAYLLEHERSRFV
jgi:hypothetical protein